VYIFIRNYPPRHHPPYPEARRFLRALIITPVRVKRRRIVTKNICYIPNVVKRINNENNIFFKVKRMTSSRVYLRTNATYPPTTLARRQGRGPRKSAVSRSPECSEYIIIMCVLSNHPGGRWLRGETIVDYRVAELG